MNRPGWVAVCGMMWLAFSVTPATHGSGSTTPINRPAGDHVNLTEECFADVPSWSETERLVLTPYFYWYDVYTMSKIVNPDGSDALTIHPATLDDFSFRSVEWHRKQLRDMIEAGIDVVLPAYWGEPSQRRVDRPVSEQLWSYAGIPPLIEARARLVAEGLRPPRIGLFYDTLTLDKNLAGKRIDLTTPFGRQWFYESVRDFFSLVPPEHWALVDGRPLVFLYIAPCESRYDQTCIDHLQTAFAQDFGGRVPYIVRDVSWQFKTDNVYAWGGALGMKNLGVASLGPGYDHSAVPGRDPLVVDRQDGAFFKRNWARFLRNPSNWVLIETWNEFHEGTSIAESREYGRQFIELNRRYVDLFKQGATAPCPGGCYTDSTSVHVDLRHTNISSGLVQVDLPDGRTVPAEIGDSACRAVIPTEHPGSYMYFIVDDSFKCGDLEHVDLVVEYFDHAKGRFTVQFDGNHPAAPLHGAYSLARRSVTLRGTATWKTARFRLAGARFANLQHAGTDFRLAVDANAFHVRRVELIRAVEKGSRAEM